MNVLKIEKCRVCGSGDLGEILSLGEQELTGVFPKSKTDKLTSGLLNLVFCPKCGLLQLGHSYSLDEMYGDNYGYRSGLNASMVRHLSSKINTLESIFTLSSGEVVLDIGSNDGTALNAYRSYGVERVGMDPTGNKFRHYYNEGIKLVPEFFSAEAFVNATGKKAKIVTTIAMFYDLESPIDFAKQVESVLDDNGIWHFEQSYMPTMLRNNAYDTICHEHLEYYSLSIVKYILEAASLRIIDVSTNDINGGSFAVTAAKASSSYSPNSALIEWYLGHEAEMGLGTVKPYLDFADRVKAHKKQFCDLLEILCNDGRLVCGYGASTKGNVILQYCGITEETIKAIGEVNPDKYGSFTPGTLIPIDDENIVKGMQPDYLVVFPWHFRNGILSKEADYLESGGRFIFPLPFIDIV